jgi:uncharacterized protein YjbJ (UPF0337 family)
MDWERIRTEWKEIKGAAKEQWGRLTDDDLLEIAGQREQLHARIRKRYRIAEEEAERQIRQWEERVQLGPPTGE